MVKEYYEFLKGLGGGTATDPEESFQRVMDLCHRIAPGHKAGKDPSIMTDKEFVEYCEPLSEDWAHGMSVPDKAIVLQELLSHFPIETKHTLDIGCGICTALPFLQSKGVLAGEITGVDPSESMINQAKEISKKLGVYPTFIKSLMQDLNLEKESFDLVVSTDVLHLTRYWDVITKKAIKSLSDGGSIFIAYGYVNHRVHDYIAPGEMVGVLVKGGIDVTDVKEFGGEATGFPRVFVYGKKQQVTQSIIVASSTQYSDLKL